MRPRSAFTLVEVLIVVIILGILAAVIVPQFTSAADESRANATAITVRGMMRKLSEMKARDGTFPATITADMFEGEQLPVNPYDPDATTTIQVDTTVDKRHPASKTIHSAGAFWYNPTNGIVRARVTEGADDAETIALYNAANSCKVTSLAQTD